jgi:DNA polymerase III subunit epsilon
MVISFRRLRLARPLCAVDVETTGTDPRADRIIEVGAVRLEPGGHVRVLEQLVNPLRPIPPQATAVHGIGDAHVAGRPPFAAVAPGLATFLADVDLAGFNLPFDLLFLSAEFARAGQEFDLAGRALIDALAVYRRKEPRNLSAAVQFYLGRRHTGGHRAAADARAALQVLDAQLTRYRDLPARPQDLHRALVPVDVGGRLRRDADGRLALAFGRHAGRPLAEVALADPAYLTWVLANVPLLGDARRLVESALYDHPAGVPEREPS